MNAHRILVVMAASASTWWQILSVNVSTAGRAKHALSVSLHAKSE